MEARTELVHVRVTPTEKEALEAGSRVVGETLAGFVRTAVMMRLAEIAEGGGDE